MTWSRIPAPIESEADRRTLVSILASAGLETRIVKARSGTSKSARISGTWSTGKMLK